MNSPPRQISLAGAQLGGIRHVCAFFASDDEEYRVLLPFIREGLSHGDKTVTVINPQAREQHQRRLESAGIDATAHERSGQLQVLVNTEVYLQDGRFDQDRMISAFEQMAVSARKTEGFPMSRVVCRMDWASGEHSHIEDVIEFESRVDDVWRRYDDAVICTYHLAKLTGDAVIDIMRTHPMVIIGGYLQQNPFFVPPQEFLPEYRRKRAGRSRPV